MENCGTGNQVRVVARTSQGRIRLSLRAIQHRRLPDILSICGYPCCGGRTTYAHGKGATEIIEDDPRAWVARVVHCSVSDFECDLIWDNSARQSQVGTLDEGMWSTSDDDDADCGSTFSRSASGELRECRAAFLHHHHIASPAIDPRQNTIVCILGRAHVRTNAFSSQVDSDMIVRRDLF